MRAVIKHFIIGIGGLAGLYMANHFKNKIKHTHHQDYSTHSISIFHANMNYFQLVLTEFVPGDMDNDNDDNSNNNDTENDK